MAFLRLQDVPGPMGWSAHYDLFRRRLDMGVVLREISQAHGDLARIPIPGAPKVLLSHPDDIQEVLATKAAMFRLFGQDLLRRLIPWGQIAIEGQVHDDNRSQLVLAMRKILSRRIPRLSLEQCQRGLAPLRDGDMLDLYQFARDVTLAMSSAALFPQAAERELTGHVDPDAFLKILSNTNAWLLGIPVVLQKMRHLAQLPHTLQMLRLRRRVHAQLRESIRLVRQRGASGPQADALTLLTDGSEIGGPLRDEFLADNMMTLLLAGYETGHNVLTWAMWEAAHREDLQTHLAEEGSRLSDDPEANNEWINTAPWTDAVVQEALRMYPSVWTLPRQSLFEYRLRDHLFDAGTIFYTSQWVTHRDPRWFPQPDRFQPERWLEAASPSVKGEADSTSAVVEKPAGRVKHHPFAFFPFGGGKRFCLGKAVFDFEAGLLLGSLFREWRLEPVQNCHPRPRFYVTMQPDPPPLVVLRRR